MNMFPPSEIHGESEDAFFAFQAASRQSRYSAPFLLEAPKR